MKNSYKILLLILILLFTIPLLFYKVVLDKVKTDQPDAYKAMTQKRPNLLK
ncbi:MAG: hypothetical protein J7599_02150 [Niabella sp.]|nr:hypothetical protein [Niabella sp.]